MVIGGRGYITEYIKPNRILYIAVGQLLCWLNEQSKPKKRQKTLVLLV